MTTIPTGHPLAVAAVAAIHTGDVDALRDLLVEHPELAAIRLGDDDPDGMSRTLLHVVTDFPGHYPNGAQTVAMLVAGGADVDGRFRGPHEETALHWAASCDDVAVLDALLDAGADIEAPGSVLGGGPPLADACGFGQWNVARRLVERGAHVLLKDAAALGLDDRVAAFLREAPPPAEVSRAFWSACAGGRRGAADLLLDAGAEIDWLPFWGERATPLDAATREGATELVAWLRARGAHAATELPS